MRRGLLFRQLELGEIVHVAATVWRMLPATCKSNCRRELWLGRSAVSGRLGGHKPQGCSTAPNDEMQDNREAA